MQAARLIRDGRLSVMTLLESCFERIAATDSVIHAWAVLDNEGATRVAYERQHEVEHGRIRGPLHGIPVGVKDNIFTAGIRTEAGSQVLTGFVPDHDASVVERLKASGAIVMGKTHMVEFGFSDPALTRNPWNLEHTPGGSSSGSAAAVATRMCPVAIGSQTGGSVLRPAAYNGVVGLKPRHGRISTYGLIPISRIMDHVGVLTRSLKDAILVLACTAGFDARDPYSLPEPVPDYLAVLEAHLDPPRLGLLRRDFFQYADDELQRHTEAVVERLASAGAVVDEVVLSPNFSGIREAAHTVMTADAAAYHQTFKSDINRYRPGSRAFIEEGLAIPGWRYSDALQYRRQQQHEMAIAKLDRLDALITPGASSEAPRDLGTTGDSAMHTPWSFLGFPTVVLPTGLSKNGLPLGVQLVGSPKGEARLWAIANWCERALRVNLRPPDLA
jgi:Asp-tRNA(Asn)/Glu-tRNA(Gln) amidotransferase A subunit family amidase